jgi:hypothetical protein
MPTLRQLRTKEVHLSDSESFEDEDNSDASSEDDEFYAAAEEPFQVSFSQPIIPSGKTNDFSGHNKPQFECDKTLPKTSLEVQTKYFLMQMLDRVGGPNTVCYQNRLVKQLCDDFPNKLGCAGSIRRKQVKWLVDRWKRCSNFVDTRKALMDDVALLSPHQLIDLPPPKKPSKKVSKPTRTRQPKTSKKAAAEEPKPLKQSPQPSTSKKNLPPLVSPPSIAKRASTADTKMPPTKSTSSGMGIGSPVRLFRSTKSTKKKGE